MKSLFTLFFTLTCTFSIIAQEIYISSTDDKLYRLDINNCSYDFIVDVQSEVYDISFHPNGNLYGISGNGNFYEIDTLTGATSIIHDFDGQSFNSLTIAADNLVYTIGSQGELWSYNIANGNEIYLGDIGYSATGDLTFFDGNLYAAATGDRIVRIDLETPSNSSVVIDANVSGGLFGGIYGIVSFAEDCDDVNAYAITNGDSEIYQIDFTTNSLQLICELDIEAGGGASTFEFFASALIVVENIDIQNSNCDLNNGVIAIDANGGTGSISYSIDGMNFQASGIFDNLPNGSYTLIISDSNGCTISQEAELTSTDSPQIIEILSNDASCGNVNGSMTITATGGIGALEYSIDGSVFQSSGIFENLPAGAYIITVRDGNNCSATQNFDVDSNGIPSISLVQQIPVTCNQDNGLLAIEGSDGTPPYQYAINGIDFQDSGVFDNLNAGTFYATIMDFSGCIDSIEVIINAELPASISDVETIPTSCNEENGALIVNASGGTEIEYSIDGNSFQTSNSFDNLVEGNYLVSIQDENACVDTQSVVILQNALPLAQSIETISTSCGAANGTIIIENNVGGGILNYSLNGSDYQEDNMFSDLDEGNYTVFIKDENDCVLINEVEVSGSTALTLREVERTNAVCGEYNGGFLIDVDGGTGQIAVSLNGGDFQTNLLYNNLSSGAYQVAIMDEIGCTIDTTLTVEQEECPIYIPNAFSPNGDGYNDEFQVYLHPGFSGKIKALRIFDRWGALVFQGLNFDTENSSWDGTHKGKKLNTGAYVYMIELLFEERGLNILKGSITIIN